VKQPATRDDDPPLRAVRYRLPAGTRVDPLRLAQPADIVFDATGERLVGLGTARTILLERGLGDHSAVLRAQQALASIPCEDELGEPERAVRALSALPFDRDAPASLTVPALLFGEDHGRAWVTVVGAHPHRDVREALALVGHVDRAGPARRDRPPSPVAVRRETVPFGTDADFRDAVRTALRLIEAGDLSKVVLARQMEVRFVGDIDIPGLLARWRVLEPECTIFSMPGDDGTFVGASPELLVARAGALVSSRPLAGTRSLASDRDGRALKASSKDANEHRLVVESIAASLAPWCAVLEVSEHPEPVRLRNMVHLGSAIHGVLHSDGGDLSAPPDGGRSAPAPRTPGVLELVSLLHPTPAVGGVPRTRALEVIAELERERRGQYAGPVGWVDAGGDGVWVVGIRAGLVRGDAARLAAGVGIVAGSDPETELGETTLKLAAVVDVLDPLPTPAGRPGGPGAEADRFSRSA